MLEASGDVNKHTDFKNIFLKSKSQGNTPALADTQTLSQKQKALASSYYFYISPLPNL